MDLDVPVEAVVAAVVAAVAEVAPAWRGPDEAGRNSGGSTA